MRSPSATVSSPTATPCSSSDHWMGGRKGPSRRPDAVTVDGGVVGGNSFCESWCWGCFLRWVGLIVPRSRRGGRGRLSGERNSDATFRRPPVSLIGTNQRYRLQRSTNRRQRGSGFESFVAILSRWLPLLVLSEDSVGRRFEIVHLSGFHRPDEGRQEEQRQQQCERKGDIHRGHARILQPFAAYTGPRYKAQGTRVPAHAEKISTQH